jgi:hypothetical protein
MLRTMMLASAFALGLAGTAGAATITGSSSGAFTAITNCTGYSGGSGNACCIGSGTHNVLDLSGSNNGTLTGNTVNFTGNTPLNNVTIGSLTWVDNSASGFDTNFGVTYTLTINFTAPNLDAVGRDEVAGLDRTGRS